MSDEILKQDNSGLPELPNSDLLTSGGFLSTGLFGNLTNAGSCRLPPHATPERDIKLRELYENNEFLQGIISTLQLVLYNTLDITVQAKHDVNIHKELATIYNTILSSALDSELELFLNDLLVTDNGGFLFIESNDPFHMPLSTIPTGLRCLDSLQCIRTRNETYPVVYIAPQTGTKYPIHYSRIIYLSQSPSNDWRRNKIGFSSISKINLLGRQLLDLTTYSLEQLGSLEANRIVHASGISVRELKDAVKDTEIDSRNAGRTHSSKIVYLASRDPNGKLSLIDLKSGSIGADRREDVETLIALMSMAINIQTFVLLESTQSSSTRGAAKESIKLSNGYKLPAWFFKKFTTQLNNKFLPQTLEIKLNGDASDIDGTKSRIALNQALTAKNNITSGITNTRIERERLFFTGVITESQFEHLELADERLPNGLHISSIFYDQQMNQHSLLQFSTTDDILNAVYSEELITEINVKISDCVTRLNASTSVNITKKLTQILYALQWLENQLQKPDIDIDVVDLPNDKPAVQPQNDLQNSDGPRDRDLEDNNQERDLLNENNIQEKDTHEHVDWLYEVLTGNDDYVEDYVFTKEATRRFQSAIRSITRGLWSGEINKSTFVNQLTGSLTNLLTSVYNKTVDKLYNVSGDESQLDELLNRNEKYADGFADYVLANKKGIGKLSDVYSRADNWIALYDEVESLAMLDPNGEDNKELIWRYGDTIEHCGTCSQYANVVKTRKEWAKLAEEGIRPQSRSLDCKGYKCKCSLQEV